MMQMDEEGGTFVTSMNFFNESAWFIENEHVKKKSFALNSEELFNG